MSGENDDEMRHIIDAEVLQLRLRVSKLLSKRNALAPISRLPTELMTIIFIYARDFSKNKSRSTMALKLSWICRDWRHISLNASRLWAEIDFKFGRQAGVQEFLSRSRQASLSVALSYDSEVIDTVLDSSHRICGFDLSFDAFEPHRSNHLNLHHIWMKDAPLLCSLTLHGTYLPEIPLAHLQHLQLRNCAFPWSSPQLCALTTLSIIDPATTTALVDLLSNLAGLPELTHLTLEAVLSGPPLPSGLPQANLPKLQDFRITNEGLPTLTTLIDHLSVSKGALIFIEISDADGRDNPSDLLDAISRSRSCKGSTTSLELAEAPYYSAFEFTEHPPHSEEQPILTAIRFDGSRTPHVTQEVSNYLDLNSVLELSQIPSHDFRGYRASDRWSKTFGKLPKLRQLTVYEHAAYFFVQLLRDEAEEAKENLRSNEIGPLEFDEKKMETVADKEENRLFYLGFLDEAEAWEMAYREPGPFVPRPIKLSFEALRYLVLDFPCPKKDEDDPDGEHFRDDLVDEENIIYNLTTRVNEGIGLTKLVCRNWLLSEETIDKLNEIVETVVD